MTDERYERARRRVEALRGFYVHLFFYVAVNAILVVIDLLTSGSTWFYWSLGGWGIGLVAHAVSVFAEGPFASRWEERKIAEYMARHTTTAQTREERT